MIIYANFIPAKLTKLLVYDGGFDSGVGLD